MVIFGRQQIVPVLRTLLKTHTALQTNLSCHVKPCHLRCFSSTVRKRGLIQPPEGRHISQQGQLSVDQFGKIKVTGTVNVDIAPNLNASDYQNGQSLVHYCVHSPKEGHIDQSCDLHYDNTSNVLTISCTDAATDDLHSNTTCQLKLPIKADINIDLKEGENDVFIENMESGILKIYQISGKCRLKSNKCTKVTVDNEHGDITCEGVLQGDISLTTGHNGRIRADRLQGSTVSLNTDAGDINVQSIYTEKTDITTETGHIYLKNCHRKTKVDVMKEGSLKIDSLDGNLLAFIVKGDTDVYISRQERVMIRTRDGNVNLRIPADHVAGVELHADDIIIEDDIVLTDSVQEIKDGKLKITGELNGTDEDIPSTINCQGNYHVLHAECNNGTISLKCQDWFSSLNLSLQPKSGLDS